MSTCGQSELEKEVEDVKLLQESLQYQEDDPSQQQQALRALGEILAQNRRAQDYFCSSHGLDYVLNVCKTTKHPELCRAALYTLAMATDGNDISQRALTKKNVFHMLRSHLQAKNSSATPTSAFLLLTICADNSEGQNLARETKCLHSLCDLFKSCLPVYKTSSFSSKKDELWFNNMEKNSIQLWNAVVLALQSLVQNPQNAQNQRLCCRLLPVIVNILQLATTQWNIILPTTTLVGAIVSGNDECQSKVRLLGGLRALINVLKQHASQESPTCTDQDLYFIEHVVNTIGAAIAGHGMCQESAADLGLVSLLIKCLDISQSPGASAAVAKQFRTKCILSLSICIDTCERNQQQLRQRGGVGLLVELLTHEQSEEFRRVAIFVLHCITGNSQGERSANHLVEEIEQEYCYQADRQEEILSQVASPTREVETQTDCNETQSVCTAQSRNHSQVCVSPTGEAIQQRSQNTRKANQRKKRLFPTKVLKPLVKSRSTQSTNAEGTELQPMRKDAATCTRSSSSSQDQIDCVACDSFLNSKNFLSTLRCCSKLCPYHRELGEFLHQKMIDLRRRKHTCATITKN